MSVQRKILLVEDEESLAAGLVYALEKEGYAVELARDGKEGLSAFAREEPDLVLLDLMLPRLSGFDVLERLRSSGSTTPVVLLTAKGQEADKVRGFDLGADDHVTKPFGLAELLARIRARLRRANDAPARPVDSFRIGGIEIDLRSLVVRGPEGETPLTVREADMLRLLWRERGRAVSRERFLDEVWGMERFPTTRTVDQHVAQLRKKIEIDPRNPRHLVTVFGLGYRLDP